MQRGSTNKAIIVGHVGSDPETRYTPSGTAVARLSLATNEVFRNKDGIENERTEWHRITSWGRQAEFVGNHVKKGQLLYVEGRLQTRKWQDRNNVDRWSTEIVADNITMLGGAKGEVAEPAAQDQAPPPQPPDDDDIPF